MFRSFVRIATAVAVAGFLASCATPYQEMGALGGVTAAPLSPDLYRISARGNGYTDRTMVQDYVLLKAAETTRDAGGKWFSIMGDQDATGVQYGQTPGTMHYGRGWAFYNPGQTYQIVKPGIDTIIRIDRVKQSTSIEAVGVIAAIGPRVLRPNK